MSQAFYQHLQTELDGIRAAGLFKAERIITTPQGAVIKTADGREVINLCANNYLGLSSHPKVIEAAHEALRTPGSAVGWLRFFGATKDLQRARGGRLARFLAPKAPLLSGAPFAPSGALWEP